MSSEQAIAILAGGKSSRMGQDKATLLLDDRPMLRHVIDACTPLNLPTYVIATDTEKYAPFGLPVLPDLVPGIGALGGIHAALKQLSSRQVLCLACDTPFVQTDLLRFVLERDPAALVVAPRLNDRWQPLHARYDRRALPRIEAQIAAGEYRMQALLDALAAEAISEADLRRHDPQLRSFQNINTPQALTEATKNRR